MEKLKIVYEDGKKIVIFKPAGVLTQSGKSFDTDIVSQVLTYRRSKGEDTYAAVINRLDRPVSGLVLLAKTRQEAARLSIQMQKTSFNKMYYAILCGKLTEREGTFVDYLLKDGKNNVSSVVVRETPGAKRAELKYQVVKHITLENRRAGETFGDVEELTLVRIHLITGRHHQIRVQFSARNMPLLGDVKYGGERGKRALEILKNSGKRMIQRYETALCAYSLTVDGNCYEINCPWEL